MFALEEKLVYSAEQALFIYYFFCFLDERRQEWICRGAPNRHDGETQKFFFRAFPKWRACLVLHAHFVLPHRKKNTVKFRK